MWVRDKLSLHKSRKLQPERRLFRLVAVGDEPSDQVDQKVNGTAMARMLDLADVFELIIDRLDDRSFAKKEFV
jgi:hypothetical protein